ncbi:hypothetical protein ACFFP0_26730 [Rhizobium puerariae]|uniref:Uncharacterized protein n=1 Tax=Rhizobium puerariae TaxID=1585791 RepID=A0ABV6APA4_9HYPH
MIALQRKPIEDAIKALLAVLDMMDGNPDEEEPGDMEPSLGWTIHGGFGLISADDREIDEVAA